MFLGIECYRGDSCVQGNGYDQLEDRSCIMQLLFRRLYEFVLLCGHPTVPMHWFDSSSGIQRAAKSKGTGIYDLGFFEKEKFFL